ncbi:methyltransferase domain-containing protein [Streptomyces sp. NBC_01795]|uniref:class I SAM-dependent DNA methyltransferase n=1 Tax=unclassified Streptomyces TaxID=2593676 RepID=UPI002DDC7267|nr:MULTISPECIES: methyltransferase domain-containing protein [unclassified Streptomyces]WSA90414.1 methyltransferase domain-containing protein [Streptomyces sp. NBC_01795]WSB74641.1 methyltransferase domain-containing protein [Streptomyces sp. NBC_01775]
MTLAQAHGEPPADGLDHVRDQYDRMAAAYDVISEWDDYAHWVALYHQLIDQHGAPGRELVDLGCGTGKGTLRLAASGFTVTGIDLSPEMIRAARAKPGAEQVRFLIGDVRKLPQVGTFDVAVTLGLPLNHLEDDTELLEAFQGVARLLRPGGLFVFDLNTAGFCRGWAERPTVVSEKSDRYTVMRGSSSPRHPEAVDVRIDHFSTSDGATWERSSAEYSLSYFSPPVVARLLAAAGFTQVACHGLDHDGLHSDDDQQRDTTRLVVARVKRADATADPPPAGRPRR